MTYVYIAILFIVFYAIGVVRIKHETGLWLMPWVWSQGIFLSLFGVFPRMRVGHSGDSEFMDLTLEMATEAHAYACEMMIQEGVVYPEAYVKRQFDCENFAQAMKHYFDIYISREYHREDKGVPTRIMGYRMDDGRGHAIMVAQVDGKSVYYNSYPKKGEILTLSLKEISTLEPVING